MTWAEIGFWSLAPAALYAVYIYGRYTRSARRERDSDFQLADARSGCAKLIAERVRILDALGLMSGGEAKWSEEAVLAEIKALRMYKLGDEATSPEKCREWLEVFGAAEDGPERLAELLDRVIAVDRQARRLRGAESGRRG